MQHNAAALNPDVVDTASPPIPEAVGWIAQYDGAYGPPINLVQAVPGIAPHDRLLAALSQAGADPAMARYGDIFGDAALREVYAAQSSQHYAATINPQNTAITSGCNMAFVMAVMAVAKAGDAVLVPCPWYFNHQMTLSMLGIECRPLPCRADNGYVPDPEHAARLMMDGRVRAIIIVSPNNPTGAVYPAQVLTSLMSLCRNHGAWMILDETYRDFLPRGMDRGHDLYADPDWGNHLIGLYSFSKAYAMPGWRLGSIHAGTAAMAQIGKLLDCVQISPVRAGQVALAQTMPILADWREENRREINRRTEAFLSGMAHVSGWKVEQAGAYFAYVRHPFAELHASTVCKLLMQQRGVMTLPASAFGPDQEHHLRVAIANVSLDVISGIPARLDALKP
jgi:aspartate/methionine/tyrosine aminotransferase